MAGQSAMLTRKESLRLQKSVAMKEATPMTTGSSGDPECHPATPGVKKSPTGHKG